MSERKIVSSLGWKLLERGGFHGIKMLIQIILARLLMPESFGVIGILLVFVDLCTILVQNGLNTALIQSREEIESDYSTVFWFSIALSSMLYMILYFAAPVIAEFYCNPKISKYLRVIGIILFGSATNSIQIAYASRRFNFKAQFICNALAVLVSGIIGILMAYNSAGVWALIIQQIVWQYSNCLFMIFAIKWIPSFTINYTRLKPLIGFGWKMLASSLLIRMNTMLGNLVIGKEFSTDALAYYTKAQSYPTAFSDVVVASVSSVALVSVSKIQDEKEIVKSRIKAFMQGSFFFIAPIVIGLACVAESFVRLLLTEKWLPCVPFLRLFCLMYLFQPACAIYGQAICGIGRSDLYLRVFLIVKPIGLLLMFLAIWMSDSLLLFAASIVLTSLIELIAQACIMSRLFRYSVRKQLYDWGVPVTAALVMAVPVYAMNHLNLPPLTMLLLQISTGLVLYTTIISILRHPMVETLMKVVRKN